MSMIVRRIVLLLCVYGIGCGDLERGNPYDPANAGSVDPATLLIGSWSRADVEKNEVYTFKQNRSVLLYDYSPGPGADSTVSSLAQVDRNAPYPQTVVVIYSGTYTFAGNRLSMSFADVISTDAGGATPSLPGSPRVVALIVRQDELVMAELDGDRVYARFD
jgi:hypothetical protein